MELDVKELLRRLYKMEEVDKATAQTIYNQYRKDGKDIFAASIDNGVREGWVW